MNVSSTSEKHVYPALVQLKTHSRWGVKFPDLKNPGCLVPCARAGGEPPPQHNPRIIRKRAFNFNKRGAGN